MDLNKQLEKIKSNYPFDVHINGINRFNKISKPSEVRICDNILVTYTKDNILYSDYWHVAELEGYPKIYQSVNSFDKEQERIKDGETYDKDYYLKEVITFGKSIKDYRYLDSDNEFTDEPTDRRVNRKGELWEKVEYQDPTESSICFKKTGRFVPTIDPLWWVHHGFIEQDEELLDCSETITCDLMAPTEEELLRKGVRYYLKNLNILFDNDKFNTLKDLKDYINASI